MIQTARGPLAEALGLVASSSSNGTAGVGPTGSQGNGSGISVWTPTAPPAGAPAGTYRVDQNGNVEKLGATGWVPYTPGDAGSGNVASVGVAA